MVTITLLSHYLNHHLKTINECFIRRVIGPHVLRKNQSKSLLFLDSAPCHKIRSVKSNLEISPTSLFQPYDVSWFKSIKRDYSRRWTNWYTGNDMAFTRQGNLKSTGYANVILKIFIGK